MNTFMDYVANPRVPNRRLALVQTAGALIGVALAVAALLLASV
jgi:hypothetical protein